TQPSFPTRRSSDLVKRSRNQTGNSPENEVIVADDITIHPAQKTVFRQGKEISLTPREYEILLMLAKNKEEVISKADLMKEIWGTSFDTNTNTVEVYINFLRNKVDKPFGKNSIKTKIGFGYYFDPE